jgi:hypothetical protein
MSDRPSFCSSRELHWERASHNSEAFRDPNEVALLLGVLQARTAACLPRCWSEPPWTALALVLAYHSRFAGSVWATAGIV